jgi:hypothetical protein
MLSQLAKFGMTLSMSTHCCFLSISVLDDASGTVEGSTYRILESVQYVSHYFFSQNSYTAIIVLQSQIKKEFFGALRIRKVQDAQDPTLTTKRPSTTVHVYDAVKTRMDEALQNARE